MAVDDNFERDAVEGLIEYVEEIKPFHCKIAEVLVEYIYTDSLQVNISDDLQNALDIDVHGFISGCEDAYDTGNYDVLAGNIPPGNPIGSVNLGTNSITINDINVVDIFLNGKQVNIVESSGNDGAYIVDSSNFDGTNTEVFFTSPSLSSSTADGIVVAYVDDNINLPLSNYDLSADPSCDYLAQGSPTSGELATSFNEVLVIDPIPYDLIGGEFDVEGFDNLDGNGFDF